MSGYPFEGWNHEPDRELYLRSFTQLTAIGQCMELLANIAAGQAEVPFLSRDQALARLTQSVKSLRQDQQDPSLAPRGCSATSSTWPRPRLGPLTADVDKATFLDGFGPEQGRGPLEGPGRPRGGSPARQGPRGGHQARGPVRLRHFDGPLAPFRDDVDEEKIMALLDRRSSWSSSATTPTSRRRPPRRSGPCCCPRSRTGPRPRPLRRELEAFLDDQKDGYAHLYDAEGRPVLLRLGRQQDRLSAGRTCEGKWVTGHMDYLVNEFRGPATFVCLRFGLPLDAIGNLGFKMKPYRMAGGREVFTLAPWEGSAFQALGLQAWR